MCMSSISNLIYHRLSHSAAFYTLNGRKVNVMLELRRMNNSLDNYYSDTAVDFITLGAYCPYQTCFC